MSYFFLDNYDNLSYNVCINFLEVKFDMAGFIIGAIFGAIVGGAIGGGVGWAIGGAILGGIMGLGTATQQNDEARHKKEVESLLKDIKENKKS